MDNRYEIPGQNLGMTKKNAKQNSGIRISYLASFSLTCGFHLLFNFEQKPEANFEINS